MPRGGAPDEHHEPGRAREPSANDAHEILSRVVDDAPLACFQTDAAGSCTYVNRRWCEYAGLDRRSAAGDGWLEAVHPADREHVRAALRAAAATGEVVRLSYRFRSSGGRVLPVAGEAVPTRDADGAVIGHVGWLTDEQWLRQGGSSGGPTGFSPASASANTRDGVEVKGRDEADGVSHGAGSERLFRVAFESAPLGMALLTFDGRFVETNPAYARLLGYGSGTPLPREASALVLEDDRDQVDAAIARVVRGEVASSSLEVRMVRADGRMVWVLAETSLVHSGNGEPDHLVIAMADITDRKLLEERLVHEIAHDPLTGLPNRVLLEDHLSRALARAERRTDPLAVLYVDLDGFKAVNDSLGHAAGDALLVEVADRLRDSMRTGDLVARWGGDEFVIVCEDVTDAACAVAIAERTCRVVAEPYTVLGRSAVIGASIGIIVSRGGDATDVVIDAADRALYESKQAGRGRVTLGALASA